MGVEPKLLSKYYITQSRWALSPYAQQNIFSMHSRTFFIAKAETLIEHPAPSILALPNKETKRREGKRIIKDEFFST